MKPTFPLLLCAVALACSLAVWAFMREEQVPLPVPWPTNAADVLVTRNGATNRFYTVPGAMKFSQIGDVMRVPDYKWSNDISPTHLILKDVEQIRIINELVEAGMTPQEAALAYKRVTEAANIERSTRPPMPGVRTNIDLKRFPLFEEAP